MSNDESSLKELNNIQVAKLQEIIEIDLKKIAGLERILSDKNNEIARLTEEYSKLKNNFDFNLGLIKERDEDILQFEKGFDEMQIEFKKKNEEIAELRREISDLKSKIANERSKKSNNEEMYKETINQLKFNSKEEIKKLSKEVENKAKEIATLNQVHFEEMNRLKSDYEKRIEKANSSIAEEIQRFKTTQEKEFTEMKNEKHVLSDRLANCEKELARIKNENINLIKEKHEMELNLTRKNDAQELTILELNSKWEFLNEKLRVLADENEMLKQKIKENFKKKKDNMSMNSKDLLSYKAQIDEVSQKIKQYEIENEKLSMNESILNNKIIRIEESHLEAIKSIRNEYNISRSKFEDEIKELRDELKRKNEENYNLRDQLKNKEYELKDAIKSLETKSNSNKDIEAVLKMNQEYFEGIIKNMAKPSARDKNQSEILDNKFHMAADYFLNPDNQQNESVEKTTQRNRERESHAQELLELKKKYEDEINDYKLIIEAVKMELDDFKMNGVAKLKEDISRKDTEIVNLKLKLSELEKQVKERKDNHEEIMGLKTFLSQKENEIVEVKKSLNNFQKENSKLKTDRDKLSNLCSNLKKEINRLENEAKMEKAEHSEENEEFEKNLNEYYVQPYPQANQIKTYGKNVYPQLNHFGLPEHSAYTEEKFKTLSNQIEFFKQQTEELGSKLRNPVNLEKTSNAKTLLNTVVNKSIKTSTVRPNNQGSGLRSSKSRSRSPSLDRFQKGKIKVNEVNIPPKNSHFSDQPLESVRFDPEFVPQEEESNPRNKEKGSNVLERRLIDNVKERILKKSAKPKSKVRNYGIRDDTDPNAIKVVYDN